MIEVYDEAFSISEENMISGIDEKLKDYAFVSNSEEVKR